MEMLKDIGIYIHIPFCVHKCYYCDFCSFEEPRSKYEKYVNALICEIKSTQYNENLLVKTIYIGGGTPSTLESNMIERILDSIKGCFKVDDKCEITIEINPGTVNSEKLERYKCIGINRLSIGLQSTNDNILKSIGRIHNYSQFEQCYNNARKSGFSNINVDLMIGLPNQTLEDVDDSLKKVIEKDPEHISVYSLILEDHTIIKMQVDSGKLELPDEYVERNMYWNVKNTLEKNGYIQYEISNFSKMNYKSRHNTDCWKQKEYIGFGLAAHSYYNNVRYSNICNLDKYIENIGNNKIENNRVVHEVQNVNDKMNEYMILGLRMNEGISRTRFYNMFNKNVFDMYEEKIRKLENLGLIIVEKGIIKLSDKGIDFANIVWEEFID